VLKMLKERIIETNDGIQDENAVEIYKSYAKFMRDKNWYGIDNMIKTGILRGNILEVGPGPGLVGLEIAKKLKGSNLTGYEISPAMIKVAEKNASEYGINAKYVLGNAMEMPFDANSFDSVVTNGSMHEWEEPIKIYNEIYRVLREGGHYCITDLRRDVGWLKWKYVYYATPKIVRPGLVTSFNASYTKDELMEILKRSELKNAKIKYNFFTLSIYGNK
jgi:ubiquinone/menaquinone biosynthesis C-methylase UbiE